MVCPSAFVSLYISSLLRVVGTGDFRSPPASASTAWSGLRSVLTRYWKQETPERSRRASRSRTVSQPFLDWRSSRQHFVTVGHDSQRPAVGSRNRLVCHDFLRAVNVDLFDTGVEGNHFLADGRETRVFLILRRQVDVVDKFSHLVLSLCAMMVPVLSRTKA